MATPNTHYTEEQISAMLCGVEAIYFLGIGGISMSSLAAITAQNGLRVGGYDRAKTPLTEQLREDGIRVDHLSRPENLDGYGAVVYTVAIAEDQCEYREAQRRGLPLISRSNYMGHLMMQSNHRIGVAGTHGKSTTTGMLAEIFLAADRRPTVLCGAVLPTVGRAYCAGEGDTLIFEACEYMDSFLDFYPTVALILNTELDHVDFFENIERLRRSFCRFADRVGSEGVVVCNADDPDTVQALTHCVGRRVTFGIDCPADYTATHIREQNGQLCFTVCCGGEPLCSLQLRVHGRHNVLNALGAFAAARTLGVCTARICAGLERFGGVARRMEYKGMLRGARVIDDYAHHPTEIRASVAAARATTQGRLICVFQSHTYSRTAALFDDFVAALCEADGVVVAPIYAAREQNTTGTDQHTLAAALTAAGIDACGTDDFEQTANCARAMLQEGDTLLIMGAGDIEKIYPLLRREEKCAERNGQQT